MAAASRLWEEASVLLHASPSSAKASSTRSRSTKLAVGNLGISAGVSKISPSASKRTPRSKSSNGVEPMTVATRIAACREARVYSTYTSLDHHPAARIVAGFKSAADAAVAPSILSE